MIPKMHGNIVYSKSKKEQEVTKKNKETLQ